MKAKTQCNIRVAPLKSNGGITNDSKIKAMETDRIPDTVLKTVQKNSHQVAPSSFKMQMKPAFFLKIFKMGDVHAAETSDQSYSLVYYVTLCKRLEHIIYKPTLKHLEKHIIPTNLNQVTYIQHSCKSQQRSTKRFRQQHSTRYGHTRYRAIRQTPG